VVDPVFDVGVESATERWARLSLRAVSSAKKRSTRLIFLTL
jgi:hypothetical protein